MSFHLRFFRALEPERLRRRQDRAAPAARAFSCVICRTSVPSAFATNTSAGIAMRRPREHQRAPVAADVEIAVECVGKNRFRRAPRGSRQSNKSAARLFLPSGNKSSCCPPTMPPSRRSRSKFSVRLIGSARSAAVVQHQPPAVAFISRLHLRAVRDPFSVGRIHAAPIVRRIRS